MATQDGTIEVTGWMRVVPQLSSKGRVTRLEIAGFTKNRPTGKGAYLQMTLRFPTRLFEIPDLGIEIDVDDSMLEGTPAQIVADLADLRDTLAP